MNMSMGVRNKGRAEKQTHLVTSTACYFAEEALACANGRVGVAFESGGVAIRHDSLRRTLCRL